MSDSDCQRIEEFLRDLVNAVNSYEKNERKSWTNLLAVRNRAKQHLDNRPGRDD